MVENGSPDRSAISNSECSPSERFRTQSRALISVSDRFAARAAVQVSFSQLRFAEWVLVPIGRLSSSTSNIEAHTRSDRAKLVWLDEIKIISGSVILRKGSPDAAHQAADGKIEAR